MITKEIEEWANSNLIKLNKNEIKLNKFKIEFNEKEWDSLVAKLNSTRYFDELNDIASFEFGFNPQFAKELVDEWKTNFNWKEKVDELNKFEQYKMVINDVTIHFVRLLTNKDTGRKPIPLMLIDGWPGF
jgi:RNA-binding protein YlmH